MIRSFAAAAGLLSLAAAPATAQGAQCVDRREAEALVRFVAPEIIRQVGQRCATTLPAGALVRRTSGPFIAKYQADSAEAWPEARSALAKIAGPQASGLLDSSFAQPFVGTLIAPMVVGSIDPASCPAIERGVGLLQSLPPRNVAALVVLLAETDAASPQPQMRLPLCRPATRP